jgi:hypothetical protein
VVVADVGSLRNNGCGDGQARGIVVFIPLAESRNGGIDKDTDHRQEYQKEEDLEDPEYAEVCHTLPPVCA